MRFSNYLVLSLLATSHVTLAEETDTAKFEITPFASYRFGGDFDDEQNNVDIDLEDGSGVGIIAAWEYDNNRQGELLISHYKSEFDTNINNFNATDVSITYLHLGGNIKLSRGLVPFWLSGGIGVTHLSPDAKQLKDETNFSMSLGLSTKISLTDNTHVFIGGRMYGTLFDSESEVFCDSNDCAIFVEGDVWVQSEVMAGMTFSF